MGSELVLQVTSEQWRDVEADDAFKATLVFLEKFTKSPETLSVSDVRAVYQAGSEQIDLEHAVIVGCIFSSMNRQVDAFGADLEEQHVERVRKLLETRGRLYERRKSPKKSPMIGPSYPDFVTHLLHSFREGKGDAPVELRRAIEARVAGATGAVREHYELPNSLASFVDKVGGDVWSLTDEDFNELKAEGWAELAIYEFVFVAAMASGIGRLEVAWSAMQEAS